MTQALLQRHTCQLFEYKIKRTKLQNEIPNGMIRVKHFVDQENEKCLSLPALNGLNVISKRCLHSNLSRFNQN